MIMKDCIINSGVCEFTFDELCRKPAGASDYISICNQFHTMVLKGIPVFTMDSMTELRRFITLIDELYQYKVKLICTTEAPLPELFKLNRDSVLDEVFACDRTISRLEEMQTVHYLQTLHFLQKPKLVTVDASFVCSKKKQEHKRNREKCKRILDYSSRNKTRRTSCKSFSDRL